MTLLIRTGGGKLIGGPNVSDCQTLLAVLDPEENNTVPHPRHSV